MAYPYEECVDFAPFRLLASIEFDSHMHICSIRHDTTIMDICQFLNTKCPQSRRSGIALKYLAPHATGHSGRLLKDEDVANIIMLHKVLKLGLITLRASFTDIQQLASISDEEAETKRD